MTLEQCTKKELIDIINDLARLDDFGLRKALRHVEHRRYMADIKKAEKLEEEADRHFEKYIAFLKKLENKEPVSITERIEAQKHLVAYNRLIDESVELLRTERTKI